MVAIHAERFQRGYYDVSEADADADDAGATAAGAERNPHTEEATTHG